MRQQAEIKQQHTVFNSILRFFTGKPKAQPEEKVEASTEEWDKAFALAVEELRKKQR